MPEFDLNFDAVFQKVMASARSQFERPTRQYVSFAILVPTGYELPPDIRSVNIVHGHPLTQRFCLADDMCHIEGYEPTGKETPTFIRKFNQKWKTNEQPIRNPDPIDLDLNLG